MSLPMDAVEIPMEKAVSARKDGGHGKAISSYMHKWMVYLAIVQGFSVMLNLNVVFMLSSTAPKALGVDPFSTWIVLILELTTCIANTLLFWMNPVKPWLTVMVSYVQAVVYIIQMLVVQFMKDTSGMAMYLICTAMCGAIFGCNSMTSFGFVAFGPVNHLGSLSFGCALGGVVPFLFSTVFQFTLFADNTVESTKALMHTIMGFVVALSVVSGLNLTVYLRNPDIKRHYEQAEIDGISTAKCTFRSALKGLKYTWKIVLLDFINYTNILIFYPSIVPISMNLKGEYVVMLIGIFQMCDTIGRFMAVYINPRWLPCNTLNKVVILSICNLASSAFLLCCTLLDTPFFRHIVTITFGVVTFATIGGYCCSFSDRSIGEHVPTHLDKEVIVSTTSVFKIIVSVFCAISGFVAIFLVRVIQH
ncbi:hypothetical protein BgAZ_403560 [Babesia gibsoni]|uniref:Nucleoside transporter n=1 Tax=Babesia gibsoni TaxID=33632 RepID=A0AAD8LNI1_BABGI|nr:hypothetical protein BgAZ_403560 [Babesia gibsoni]